MSKRYYLNTVLIILLLLLTVRFVAFSWSRLPLHANSADGDHGAYLQLGLDLQEHGILTDGKRPPLYPLLLATFAERNWSYFTWAKIVNLVIGAITILTLFEIGRRLFGWFTGLLVALLLSVNMEFVLHSTFALAESLLIIMFLLAWFFMVRALQQPTQLRYWVTAGIFTGLAFLAKGTGPIIAICFLLTATILHRPRIWLTATCWAFIISAVVVTSPLWMYNWLNFGSPLFNSAINNVMWMDDATEKYVADEAEMPTLNSFLQEKSPTEIWTRLTDGLLQMRYFYLKLLWPTRSTYMDYFFQVGYFDALIIVGLIAASGIWWFYPNIFQRHQEALLLTIILVATFYILFAWYMAIAPYPIRFLLPLTPILYLILAAGISHLTQGIFVNGRIPLWGKAVAALIIFYLIYYPIGYFGYTTWLIAQAAPADPFQTDADFNTYNAEPIVWAKTGHGDLATPVNVMWGPSHHLPVWRHSDVLNFTRTPVVQLSTPETLDTFLQQADISYVIVDADMLDRIEELGPATGLHLAEDRRVQLGKALPTDWALGYVRPDIRCEVCVFRRISANPPIQSVDYLLGDAVQLIGYELDETKFRANGELAIILYWQSQHPTKANYTIFTQLLGPDFQLHGQMDRQPLSGQWPTSQWQIGQKFVDKFVIPVDSLAPPGDYQLLVGMYDLQTGQRALAKQNGQPLPDNAIRLHQITINATNQ